MENDMYSDYIFPKAWRRIITVYRAINLFGSSCVKEGYIGGREGEGERLINMNKYLYFFYFFNT